MGHRRGADHYVGMPLDTTTITQDRLNIESKERSNLFPWNGQFSPQLIEVMLGTYAAQGSFILDPFLGSGTVLCEAGRRGLSAFGTEINPAAFKMAEIYRFINIPAQMRRALVSSVDTLLSEAIPENLPMFSRCESPPTSDALKRALANLSSTLENDRQRCLLDALIVVLDFYEDDLSVGKIFSSWSRIKARVLALPYSESPIALANRDARSSGLVDRCVDIALTSPPYINVFNYHQHYRASAEALGWDLLAVAGSEIGSNRKHRQNRFLTVIQYCLDMTEALIELRRVCRDASRIIIVIGRESNVRKTRFLNGEILAALASRCAGLNPLERQERAFTNRFGARIYEDILHFSPSGSSPSESPTGIAFRALTDAFEYAPDESRHDLRQALEGAENVKPSPIYDPNVARVRPKLRKGAG